MTPAIGMSVGATTLAAVTADHAVTRRPVITLYRDHASQVGVPPEIPANPDEPGLVITDFVDRVGDAAPVAASDGSTHQAEQLLADGLHALAYAASGERPLPSEVVVTHPAHWTITAVEALRTALNRVGEWSQRPVPLISDVAAALTAMRASPGLPTDGIIAVCDFGGTGTSITLVDAARDYRPAGATVRHPGFSGELIDQALLNHVVNDLTAGGALGKTVAIGSLAQLRSQCRNAKEQLSAQTVTELNVDVTGFHGGVWLTRAELDGVIQEPLDEFFTAVQDTLQHNQIQKTALSAVVTVGGGANIPAITTGLSQHLGVTVISSPRPHLTAAIGAALGAGHGPDAATAAASAPAEWTPPPAGPRPTAEPETEATPAQGDWPPAGQEPTPTRHETMPAPTAPHPPAEYEPAEYELFPGATAGDRAGWHRRPLPVILACAIAVLIAGAIAVIALRHAASTGPETSTVTTETTPATSEPASLPVPPPMPSQPPVFPEIPTMLPPVPTTPPPETPETQEAP